MNFTILENPYVDENSTITTRGVMTDAKIAKLNNATKRPAIVKHWEENMPQEVVSLASPVTKDYSSLLDNVGITAVNYASNVNNSGAKKLRVNKIVNEKASNIYNSSDKIDVIPVESYKEYNKIDDDFFVNEPEYTHQELPNKKKKKVCNDCICYIS